MTDRELLELAAKAAGLGLAQWDEDSECMYYPFRSDLTNMHLWNPLEDDGDALRLAVKLQLTVCNEQLLAGAAYCAGSDDTLYPPVRASGLHQSEVVMSDYVATRRAIVLAAAEIGKSTT